MIAAIVCVDSNFGIGSKNHLLAHIPEDMKMFKDITTGHSIIMGRKTYDSLPKKPLPNRTNIVITHMNRHPQIQRENLLHSNMEYIKAWLSKKEVIEENNGIYVIGGGTIYKELLPLCERVYITKVFHAYEDVDAFFPNIDEMPEWEMTSASEIKEHDGIQYQFCVYDRNDYEIDRVSIIPLPDGNQDMIVSVRTFNDMRAVILRMNAEKKLTVYADSWEYLHDEHNLLKFIDKVQSFNDKLKEV